MPFQSWRDSALFQEILDRKNNLSNILTRDVNPEARLINLLENPDVLDKVEKILREGSLTDFTLHDEDHSFRVAVWIWRIIPEETKKIMSTYELGLLLLSAYLHDVGMSPEFEKIAQIRKFLKGDKSALTDVQIEDLQEWMDNQYQSSNIDLMQAFDISEDEINYVVSYYARSKHNDWSGEWITKHLSDIKLEGYPRWWQDVILICKSHHYDEKHLRGNGFNTQTIAGSKVNLRYLAMCLRIGDVLENDPGRTPDVVLKHRSVDSRSLQYWLKDKEFEVELIDNELHISGRPARHTCNRAVQQTVDYIEHELRLCKRLNSLNLWDKIYSWRLEPFIHNKVKPDENEYEFIEGGFKPNVAKFLDILGGTHIYGEPIWAFRELIQNAFDAVKEYLAYQKLDRKEDHCRIQIRLAKELSAAGQEEYFIECWDEGAGMTKELITEYFLKSGSPKRHKIKVLERRCEAANFNFTRTGQFGIGVLSYFMIADQIIVKTTRRQNTDYEEDQLKCWQFQLDGLHSFGELKNIRDSRFLGTKVCLRLKSDISRNIEEWDGRFQDFMEEFIVRSPANMTYISLKDEKLEINKDWAFTTEKIKSALIKDFKNLLFLDSAEDPLTKNKAVAEIEETLAFYTSEGTIPGIGTYRIHLPYFKLESGYSLFYLQIDPATKEIKRIHAGYFWKPQFNELNFSLKGIKIDVKEFQLHNSKFANAFIEVDIEKIAESAISVSRHELDISTVQEAIVAELNKGLLELLQQNSTAFSGVYESLNQLVLGDCPTRTFLPMVKGKVGGEQPALYWEEMRYPLNNTFKYAGRYIDGQELQVCGNLDPYFGSREIDWFKNVAAKFTLAIAESNDGLVTVPYIAQQTDCENFCQPLFKEPNFIRLPEGWEKILMVMENADYRPHDTFINESLADTFRYSDFIEFQSRWSFRTENKMDKATAYAYLLGLATQATQIRDLIYSKEPLLIQQAFKVIGRNDFFVLRNDFLYKCTPESCKRIFEENELKSIMPPVDDQRFILQKLID